MVNNAGLMTRRAVPMLLSGLLILLGVGANESAVQEGVSDASGTVLAEFRNAQALGIDPRGRLYVADAGRDVVAVLGSAGKRTMVLGGSGPRRRACQTRQRAYPSHRGPSCACHEDQGPLPRRGPHRPRRAVPAGRSRAPVRSETPRGPFRPHRQVAPAPQPHPLLHSGGPGALPVRSGRDVA